MSGQFSRLSSLIHSLIFIQAIHVCIIWGNESEIHVQLQDITNISAKFLISVGMLGDPWK